MILNNYSLKTPYMHKYRDKNRDISTIYIEMSLV
nr:MAG TPA: hypothetical protein [Caudoviricetes sp.]